MNMKNALAFPLLGMLAICGSVSAQTNSDDITATVTVVVPITQVTHDNQLSFPPVRRSFTSSVDPVTGGSSCAHVSFVGDAFSPVVVTSSFSAMTKVGTGGSSGVPPVSFASCTEVLSWSWGATQTSSSHCPSTGCSVRFSEDALDSPVLDGMGSLHVFVGGSCTPPSLQPHGLYSALCVVTATYLD